MHIDAIHSLHVTVFPNKREMHIEQVFTDLTKTAQLWVWNFIAGKNTIRENDPK